VRSLKTIWLFSLGLAVAAASAAIDLSAARVERLANGLTVIVLEEPTLPVVSVQMLYAVGARNEAPGTTGLAHFLEHMAFRATETFPENDVVRRIDAVGGEWHGYTWIDQTTYFATVPREHLDLLLDIEAERMSALVIDADEVEAERGAVMAELRGYEEDPVTVLTETVPQVAFLQHPYRYNTSGWPSDVAAIDHADLVGFYRRHYHPANAVLAVVGDVATEDVLARVRARFAAIPGRPPTPLPRTVEPPQDGERRVTLRGDVERSLFEIGYHAPAASSPDWPGFLLLQEVLGGGAGVNFRQDTFGVPTRPGTRLDGIVESTWLVPAAQPYLFTLSGSVDPGDEAALETRVWAALKSVREEGVGEEELAAARRRLTAELVFDLETTEDAAHQLAFFHSLGALDVLLDLDRRLDAVTTADLRELARRYLAPHQRTVGWYLPEAGPAAPPHPAPPSPAAAPAPRPPTAPTTAEPVGEEPVSREPATGEPASGQRVADAPATGEPGAAAPAGRALDLAVEPAVGHFAGSLPVVVQRSALSPTIHLRLVLPGRISTRSDVEADLPVWDHSSLGRRLLAAELATGVADLRRRLGEIDPTAAVEEPEPFESALERAAGVRRRPVGSLRPVVMVAAGDLDPGTALELLERHFGDLATEPSPTEAPADLKAPEGPLAPEGTEATDRGTPAPSRGEAGSEAEGAPGVDRLPARRSGRARLGYAVRAPAPDAVDAAAWQALLYVLTHGYEGRLGHAAIHERGLAYYIGSDYRSDGGQGWVSFQVSAEPAKLADLTELVLATLGELSARPPTDDEVAEAKRHLLGRRVSEAQSNEEISARLARDLVWYGAPLGLADLEERLRPLTATDVRRVVPAFLSGRLVVEPVEAP
jgi:zinc protease